MTRLKFLPARIAGTPEDTDRILIGVSVVIWLVLVGTSVAALVALIDLGDGGHAGATRSTHTPWPLYVIAAISALVILAAIPILLRARSAAVPAATDRRRPGRPVRVGEPTVPDTSARAGTGRLRALDLAAGTPLERIWLRGTVVLAIAAGAALIAVAIATTLMAGGRETLAWSSYGVAGVVTALIPLIPWIFLRQLHSALDRDAV